MNEKVPFPVFLIPGKTSNHKTSQRNVLLLILLQLEPKTAKFDLVRPHPGENPCGANSPEIKAPEDPNKQAAYAEKARPS
jgi:hypothetical protein